MARHDGWSALFATAFRQSSNAMVLVDARRRQVDANGAYLKLLGYTRGAVIGTPVYAFVADGPLASPEEWDAAMASGRFSGETDLVCATAAGGQGLRRRTDPGMSAAIRRGRR
jgi:PAS domain-containing protein